MPNKYEDPDDTKSTKYEGKYAMKGMKKISLYIAYLYQTVDTIKVYGCISKAFSDKFPEVILHKIWTLLHEIISKLDALSMLELREEMSKNKLKEN